MTHSPALTLAPCPFCGTQPESIDIGFDAVTCPSCAINGPTYPDKIAAWNRRPELAASADSGKQDDEPDLTSWARPITERAADMLTAYAEQTKMLGRYAEEHYLPEVEHVVEELRALSRPAPADKQRPGIATGKDAEVYASIAANYWKDAPAVVNQSETTAPVSAQGDEVDARWQPIETAPRNGTIVLLGYEGSHSEEGFWLMDATRNHWGQTGWFASDDDVLCDHPSSPSHWMPLPPHPAAPAARAQQGGQR